MQRQIIDEVQLDIRASHAGMVQMAQEVLQRHEREEEQESVQRLLNRAGHGGLAVVGLALYALRASPNARSVRRGHALIIGGALVGAAGLILTIQMTEAMNRGWESRDSRVAMLLQEERANVEVRVDPEVLRQALEAERPG